VAKRQTRRKRSTSRQAATSSASETCFIICLFRGWHDQYTKQIFNPAIEQAGLTPVRADDIYGPSPIVTDIWKSVRAARVLLADLTGRNPNVLYELGLGHALRKPVVMITQDVTDVPFDLRALRIIVYDVRDAAWAAALQNAIADSLREVLKSPERFVVASFYEEPTAPSSPADQREQRLLKLEQELRALRSAVRATDPNVAYTLGNVARGFLRSPVVHSGITEVLLSALPGTLALSGQPVTATVTDPRASKGAVVLSPEPTPAPLTQPDSPALEEGREQPKSSRNPEKPHSK
jgi:hypothetical protein